MCRRLFVSGQSMHQFKDFCLVNPLESYLWKLCGLKNLISKCIVHLEHIGGKPLVLFSEDGLIASVLTGYLPMFFGATESTVFAVSAKDTNIRSYKAVSLGFLPSPLHVS